MKQTLTDLRQQIDELDHRIVGLLNERAAIARKVGETKGGVTVYRPAREEHVLQQVSEASTGALPGASLLAIYTEIIAACRNLQKPLQVTYLGPAGTYSEEAARKHLGNTSHYRSADSIDEAVQLAESGEADVVVVPVENSTEGSVNRTLDLLMQTSLTICGEVALPIHHQLLSKEKTVEDINEVVAHPQALAQCRRWLDEHLPYVKRTAASSNAEAVRVAARKQGMAAIASKRAGYIYDMPALARNIEDDPSNTTRFLVLGQYQTEATGNDKTSFLCATPNRPGTLHKLLAVLADAGINLVRLETRPSSSALWDYVFYVDIDGHADDKAVGHALDLLAEQTIFIKRLGSYPKGS
jgi:chorismate mutase / prephenate dehydratase